MTNRRHTLGKEHTGNPFPSRQVPLPLNSKPKSRTQSCNMKRSLRQLPVYRLLSPTQDDTDKGHISTVKFSGRMQNSNWHKHRDERLIVRLVWLLLAIKSVHHSSIHPCSQPSIHPSLHPPVAIRHPPYAIRRVVPAPGVTTRQMTHTGGSCVIGEILWKCLGFLVRIYRFFVLISYFLFFLYMI